MVLMTFLGTIFELVMVFNASQVSWLLDVGFVGSMVLHVCVYYLGQTLLSRVVDPKIRGSLFSVVSLFGSCGTLISNKLGG